MRVYVVGAGAVGRYLGERLAATGAETTYAPRAIGDVVPVAADLAIVAVKADATPAAIATLERALRGSDAVVLTPQNGVGNEEALAAAFGADRVVSAALTVPVELGPGGTVVAANRGGIALAPVGSVAHNYLIAAFERTGIPTTVHDDYRAMKWSKLTLNLLANAACAITDELPAVLLRDARLFALEIRAVREAFAVMRALRLTPVDLPRYPVRVLGLATSLPTPLARALLARRIAGARGSKPPSLLLDRRAGRGTSEVDVLAGAVAREGARLGVPVPVNATYARVLGEVLRDPLAAARYRGDGAALAAEVALAG